MADDLKKIKELLEIVNNKVGKLETHLTVRSATLDLLKDQQSVMNQKLDEVQETLDSHTASLMNIEATLEGYADAYKVNKSNIERLDERLSKAEDQLDIPIPPELAIQR